MHKHRKTSLIVITMICKVFIHSSEVNIMLSTKKLKWRQQWLAVVAEDELPVKHCQMTVLLNIISPHISRGASSSLKCCWSTYQKLHHHGFPKWFKGVVISAYINVWLWIKINSLNISLSLFWHLANRNNVGNPKWPKTGKHLVWFIVYTVYINVWFPLWKPSKAFFCHWRARYLPLIT